MTDAQGGRPALQTEQIVTALDRHGVDYVLIGGLAAVVHGSAVATTDIDLVPDGNRSNLGRLAGALRELGAKMRVPDLAYAIDVPLDDHTFDAFTTASFRTPYGDVDVVLRPDAPGPRRHFTFDELNRRAHARQAFGVTIRVADLDDIISSKAAAGRPQDLAALPHLATLRSALQKHDLGSEPLEESYQVDALEIEVDQLAIEPDDGLDLGL